MDRLFAVIARINSVLLLVALLGIGAAFAYSTLAAGRGQARGHVAIAADNRNDSSAKFFAIGQVLPVEGADTKRIQLEVREKGAAFASGPNYRSDVRNLLFVTARESKARWLFDNQSNVILVSMPLRERTRDGNKGPALAIYLEYAAKDSGINAQSMPEKSTVALTKPTGMGLVNVLTDVSRVLSYDLESDERVLIIYQTGKSIRQASVSLASFAKESDTEIETIPDRI
jgi:hypothetical protein